MTVHNVVFPADISARAEFGPVFNTSVSTTAGGAERRNMNWSGARRRGVISTRNITAAEMDDFRAFFVARGGKAYGFLFQDFTDYALARQSIGTTDGTTATFQIYKRYSSGGTDRDRNITRPVSGTVQVWVDGAARTLGGGADGFTVSTTTGIVTLGADLVALLGKSVEAACQFYVPVRFDTDQMPVRVDTEDYQEWSDIPLIEVPE